MTEPSLPEESLFLQALEITSPAEQAAFLERTCGANDELRRRVGQLLDAHARGESLLDNSPVPPAPPSSPPVSDRLGNSIGPYKLLQQIGEGGMGTVWLAEQTAPVQRKVALKIVKPGMDTQQVLARFEAERQALALMEHPNIAKVLDAGVTDTSRPYFVMELVKGVPITQYCDEHNLTPRERLELFLPVCHAVQHAHQKGIIHRDLKPTNVLVARYDDRPVPKVIDFGVAKAAGPKLTERTMFTQFGQVVGTLEYMSPEQASFNALDIDTRSDVYSLGVLLYELLTGSTPLERKRLREAAFDEVLRIIREEEPPKPSTRLSTIDGLPNIAAHRRTEPAKLGRLMKGDLDWIVMKALEKDRARRYETANGLAMEVQRYLSDEPVLACPPSWAYRLKKGLRRNKGPVLAALLVVIALVVGILAASWQAIRARQSETKAIAERDGKDRALQAEQRARQEATRAGAQTLEILRAMTGSIMSRRLATQVELTDDERALFVDILNHYEFLATIKGDTPESRALRAEGYYRIGIVRNRMQDWRDALPAFEQARNIYEKLATEFPAVPAYRNALADSHGYTGQVLVELDRKAEGEAELRRSLAQYRRLETDFPRSPEYRDGIGGIHGNLASLHGGRGEWAEAERHLRDAIRADEYLAGIFPKIHEYQRQVGRWRLQLGLLFELQKKLAQAEEEVRQAIAVDEKLAAEFLHGPYRTAGGGLHRHLARLLAAQNKRTEAESEYRAALAIENKLAADFPAIPAYRRNLAKTLVGMGSLLLDLDKAADAEAEYRQALALQSRLVADFPDVPSYADQLAETYSRLGISLEKQMMSDQAIAAYGRSTQLKPQWPSAYNRMHDALSKAGRLDEAVAEYEAQLRRQPDDVLSHYLLAQVLFRKSQWKGAADHFTRVLVLNANYPEVRAKRGAAYVALGRWQEAIADYSKEIELQPNVAAAHNALARLLATCPDPQYRDPLRAVPAAKRAVELAPTNGAFWNTLGTAYYRAADWHGAIDALKKSTELRRGGNSLDWFFLAMTHWQLGEWDEARKWYNQADQWMAKNQPRNEELRRFRQEAIDLLGEKEQKE